MSFEEFTIYRGSLHFGRKRGSKCNQGYTKPVVQFSTSLVEGFRHDRDLHLSSLVHSQMNTILRPSSQCEEPTDRLITHGGTIELVEFLQ